MIASLIQIPKELYRRDRVLAIAGAFSFVGAVACLTMVGLDSRTLLGLNVWIKPFKFSASFALYFWTLAWFMPYLASAEWTKRLVRWGSVLPLLLEVPILTAQAARGVMSHFNTATPLDTVLYGVLGLGAMAQAVALAWLLVLLFRSPKPLPPVYLWAVRLGIIVFLFGLLPGFAMTAVASHTVGAAQGGPGLPLVNWSLEGGDLRIAHFLGLHAIQVIPLAGWFAGRWSRPQGKLPTMLLAGFAGVYVLMVVGTFVQALAGVPLLAAI